MFARPHVCPVCVARLLCAPYSTVDWLDTERFSSVRRDAETDTDFTVPLDTHRIIHCFFSTDYHGRLQNVRTTRAQTGLQDLAFRILKTVGDGDEARQRTYQMACWCSGGAA